MTRCRLARAHVRLRCALVESDETELRKARPTRVERYQLQCGTACSRHRALLALLARLRRGRLLGDELRAQGKEQAAERILARVAA